MRRLFVGLLLTGTTLGFAACSSSDGGGATTTPTPDAQDESTLPEAGPDAQADALEDTTPEASPGDAEAGALSPAGAVCTKNSACVSKYCYGPFGDPGNKYCSKTCLADADCASLGEGYQWACVSKMCTKVCPSGDSSECKEGGCIMNEAVAGATYNLCFDLQGKLCNKQDDCATGTTCVLGTGGKDFFYYCTATPWATLKTGETCNPNLPWSAPCETTADCGSGGLTCGTDKTCTGNASVSCVGAVCFPEGVCGGPCKADADCPAGNICSLFSINANMNDKDPLNDVTTTFASCMPFDGTLTPCAKDADCSNGEKCGLYVDLQNKVVTACRKPAAGAVAAGEACGDLGDTPTAEPNKPCEAGMCAFARCTPFCTVDSDCVSGGQCVEAYVGNKQVTAKICLPKKCATDADCAADKACSDFIGTPGATVQACFDRYGAIEEGQACDPSLASKQASCPNDAACASLGTGWLCNPSGHVCTPPQTLKCAGGTGWCQADGFCIGVCAVDADCGNAADWLCSLVPAPKDGNDTGTPTDDLFGTYKQCVYLSGSRTACTKDADCTTAGEACRPRFTGAGVLGSVCAKAIPAGVDAGAACGKGVFCKNDFCDTNDGDKDTATGTCGARCTLDTDCPNPLTCQDLDFSADGKNKLKACRKVGAGGWGG